MSILTVEKIKELSGSNPTLTVPGLRTDIKEVPRPYQLSGAYFLCARPRAILAEYPGAGKKLTTIMAVLKLFSLMKARNALVVSLGTDCDQWVEEIDHFTEGITTQLYRGATKDRRWMLSSEPDFRITTYQTAARDLWELAGLHDIIILDEVSFLKNPETFAHQHLRGLCAPSLQEQSHIWAAVQLALQNKRGRIGSVPPFNPNGQPSKWAWGLSATPLETSPIDLFSLFWALMGNKTPLGHSLERFKSSFCIMNRSTIRVPKVIRHKNGHMEKKWVKVRLEKAVGVHPEWMPEMKSRIQEYYLRHPFEIIERYLPPIEVLPVWLELGKKQRDRYQEISRGRVIADYVFHERGQKITEKQVTYAIKLFYQLRLCDGLTSIPGQKYRDSIKMQYLMNLLTGELAGEKVVVFSRFHQPLNDLEVKLNDEMISFDRIDGLRSDEENAKARHNFNDPDGARVMLLTAKGSYALNLQVARYMVAYNTLYNPKKLEQLYGRIRRPNGAGACVVYHLLCQGTVEEAMWQILREREQMFFDIFGQDQESFFGMLTPEEQQEVINFGLGAVR